MVDASHARSAENAAGALVEDVLSRVGIDPADLPDSVVARLEQRARLPDHRLVVGRYLIVGELGRGGMGVVYEAWDPNIERRVAVKTIEPELVAEEEREEVIERFRRETKIVGRLHHPAIVTIFDYGQERQFDPVSQRRVTALYYYVMEYLEGYSLARALRDKLRLSDLEAVRICANVAEALQLSHDAGIIHRDIKPSNIFLRNGIDAVLLDFGIAKTHSVALTRQGQILGTPSYLAPERLKEKEVAIDGRADIFSLGVLLFTLLTGEAPFVGADVYEVIDKIARQSHPQLARETPVGQALSRVLDRMMAKRPEDRYASAGEAARALREVEALLSDDEPDELQERTSPSAPTPLPPSKSAPEADTGRFELTAQDALRAMDAPGTDPVAPLPSRSQQMTPREQPLTDLLVRSASTEGATDVKVNAHPRAAEFLGTRPELALLRETRELKHQKGRTPQPEVTSVGVDPRPGFGQEDSLQEVSDADVEYLEFTSAGHQDEETVADGSARGRVPSALRHVPIKAHLDERATEQVVRESKRPGRPKSARIEASLVDEDDVVVKPAAMAGPDEAPTQTGYKRPPTSAAPEVVKARGDSRVPDPAELGAASTSPQVLGETEFESDSASEIELDLPKSAAVARKTFGVKSRGMSLRKPGGQMRVSAEGLNLTPEERKRLLQRRLLLLLAAGGVLGLASLAIGLRLGRLNQPQEAIPIAAAPSDAPAPRVEPRAVRRVPGTDELALARPRSPLELLADADAAKSGGQWTESARLYAAAADVLPPGSTALPRALLGRADVLTRLSQPDEATRLYRLLIKDHPTSPEAAQARVVLDATTKKVAVKRVEERVERRDPPVETAPPPPPPNALVLSDDMSPEAKCRAVAGRYLSDPAGAVRAFQKLEDQHPEAECVYWNLGMKYEAVSDYAAALMAYKRFLRLSPESPRRSAVEDKITKLEGKMRR